MQICWTAYEHTLTQTQTGRGGEREGGREGEGEGGREGERERERGREREGERLFERERGKERDGGRETEPGRERQRGKEREGEREGGRARERERERDRERERELGSLFECTNAHLLSKHSVQVHYGNHSSCHLFWETSGRITNPHNSIWIIYFSNIEDNRNTRSAAEFTNRHCGKGYRLFFMRPHFQNTVSNNASDVSWKELWNQPKLE